MNAPQSTPATPRPLVIFAAVFIGAAVILGFRFPDRLFDPQFRDEDGFVFFREDGFFGIGALTQLYNGYYCTLQRCVAFIAGFFHPLRAPAIYNWAALIGTAAVCGRIAVSRIPAAWRVGFGALFLLHPFCHANAIHLTNLFWFTAALHPLFAIERPPRSRLGKASTIGVAGFLGLSGPFAAFFAPLFVARVLLLERCRYTIALAATVVLTGIGHGAVLIASRRFDRSMEMEPFAAAGIWTAANRFFVHTFFGKLANEGSALQSAAAIVVLGLLAWGSASVFRNPRDRENRARIAILFLGAVTIYVAGVFGTIAPWLTVIPAGINTRFYLLPYLLFCWTAFALACLPFPRRWMRVPAAALPLVFALTAFRAPPFPPSTWADDLAHVESTGFGMLRIYPAFGHRHLFLARGSGRYGFARGQELMRTHHLTTVLQNAFGLGHARSICETAPVFVFHEAHLGKRGVLTFPGSHVGIVIPPGAVSFSGTYGYAPLAIPPASWDGVAGGDGVLIKITATDGELSQTFFQDFLEPAPVNDPAALRSFRIQLPPGNWKAVFLHNLAGPTKSHDANFDFPFWTDLRFEAAAPATPQNNG